MNTFGRRLRLHIIGESHGAGVGVVLDGVPPGIPVDAERIQARMAQRRPGTGPLVSSRKERDQVQWTTGVFEGHTTGAPVTLWIANEDTRSQDYDAVRRTPRPGHSDLTAHRWSRGFYDHRGGGHHSGRLTAPFVAAAALIEPMLAHAGIGVAAHLHTIAGFAGHDGGRVHPHSLPRDGARVARDAGPAHPRDGADATGAAGLADPAAPPDAAGAAGLADPADPADREPGAAVPEGVASWGRASVAEANDAVARSPVHTAHEAFEEAFVAAIEQARRDGDSLGAVVAWRAEGVPPAWGDPFFDSIESHLAHMLFSIPAVKGVSFGAGFRAAGMRGSQHNDPITADGTGSNWAGGILGGRSTGRPIWGHVAIKPTSSIFQPQQTIDLETGKAATLRLTGRHDPCIGVRAVPVVRAAVELALADLLLLARQEGWAEGS